MKLKNCELYNQFISMYFTCELKYFKNFMDEI